MSHPPSTPTPRRFLLTKRGTQFSQTPTGPPRFQSTPRFGSSSVPKPTQGRGELDIEDVEEVEDRVEESSAEDDDEEDGETQGGGLNDSIEIESDVATTSQESSASLLGNDPKDGLRDSIEPDSLRNFGSSDGSSPLEEREVKRRRVSILPMPDSSPQHEQSHEVDENSEAGIFIDRHTPTASILEIDEDGDNTEPLHDETRAPQQPTFRPPPRFKPAEVDPTTDGLPAAFSPQRRGAKYLAGGLAAGLQGWLSDIKGWEAVGQDAEAVATVTVEEIRPGRRMYLVKGRVEEAAGAFSGQFLLAGEGKLTGLGRRAVVGVGSLVILGQPVWDVELDGEVWTVSCDWSVS
ncbi:hypothetical protein B0J13DRAFT_308079 [Dactylonectria estremocensis]|uniref:Uncharacterized protein n=1 Tax=Dactylonectria estremocensis TaxID=1079267 RepID=A0A9P9F1N8_9HYPO|nr:hypothetical protein B0J13DRAFT_308079 [Dactylonectria estremocensis]